LLRCGDTFLLPKLSHLVEHLWIIITEPEPETNRAACVNITTRQRHSETTVVLQVGDHPFIKKGESVVYYVDAKILDLNLVEKILETKTAQFTCAQHQPCSAALLKRIQGGLLESKFASNGIKEYCAARWK